MKNSLTWFEIIVVDIERAAKFYEQALGVPLKREVFGGMPHAIFPYADPGVGGALVQHPHRRPSPDGSVVYLDVTHKLDDVLARLQAAGAEITLPKTDIGDPGYIALFRDTEGNVVGLHTPR